MAKRKTKKKDKATETSILTIGLDIGYGVVKAITDQTAITFPSVAGHARDIKFQQDYLTEKYAGDQITDDHGQWFVGELALKQLLPGELLRLRGRTANEVTMGNAFRLRLAKVAIAKLVRGVEQGDVVHVSLASGLPVDHMADAQALKDTFLGQHLIKTDQVEIVANITDVKVMPQAYGALYAAMLTEHGEINVRHTYMRTGVCDVGTYTVDIALDDDGEFVSSQSGSVEGGVYTAQERIAAMLERDYREKIPFGMIEQVLKTGYFTASGKTIDYRAEVEEALQPLRSATLNLMSEKWQRGTTVDVIYLAGGGAELVFEEVRDAYPQAKLLKDA
ncbi:MAG: ParM/StbA family protein [Chloroflexota bacterium]